MKKFFFGLLLLTFVLTMIPAQQNPSITIVNNTGFVVYYVYISSTADPNWGPDRLDANQVLRNGDSFTMVLPHPVNVVNRYDIRLVDLDGDSYIKWDHPVTANARIVFNFNDIVWDY